MPRQYQRTERVGQLIQSALAKLIQIDFKDITPYFMTITGVEVSKDFSFARVYISILEEDVASIEEALHLLNEARKHLRFELAKVIELRRMPELKFYYDKSVSGGSHISSLLQNVSDEDESETQPTPKKN